MLSVLIVNVILLWCVVLTLVYLVLQSRYRASYAQPSRTVGIFHPLIGQPAPPMTMQLVNGASVSLTEEGRSILIVVFDPFCETCVENLAKYTILTQVVQPISYQLFLVSLGEVAETMDVVHKHIPDFSNLSVQPRSSSRFFKEYQVTSTPTYFKIDAHCIITEIGHPDAISASHEAGRWS